MNGVVLLSFSQEIPVDVAKTDEEEMYSKR